MKYLTLCLATLLGTSAFGFDPTPQTKLTTLQYAEPVDSGISFGVTKLTADTMRLRQIAEARTPSMGVVVTQDRDGRGSRGSGCYIGNGLFLTARHVVADSRSVKVIIQGKSIPASVLTTAKADAALLYIGDKGGLKVPPVPIAMREVERGETVYGGGYDGGRVESLRFWTGRVTSFGHTPRGGWANFDYKGTNRGSVSGCSGGPTFNEKGELLGNIWGGGGGTVAIKNAYTRQLIIQTCERYPTQISRGGCLQRLFPRLAERREARLSPQPPAAGGGTEINVNPYIQPAATGPCPGGVCPLVTPIGVTVPNPDLPAVQVVPANPPAVAVQPVTPPVVQVPVQPAQPAVTPSLQSPQADVQVQIQPNITPQYSVTPQVIQVPLNIPLRIHIGSGPINIQQGAVVQPPAVQQSQIQYRIVPVPAAPQVQLVPTLGVNL